MSKTALKYFPIAILLLVGLFQCTPTEVSNEVLTDTQIAPELTVHPGEIYDAPPVRTFPAEANEVLSWIETMNFPQIRRHGWDIWESANTMTPEGMPVWESWYSGHEIFELGIESKAKRAKFYDYEKPVQDAHFGVTEDNIPIDTLSRPYSFNRYSYSLAETIWDKGYYKDSVLVAINDEYDSLNTPIVDRLINTSIDTIDEASLATKPIFQFVSGFEPTAIPYWAGVSPMTTSNMTLPIPNTWKQCVVVDPTNKLKPGDKVKMPCNGKEGTWEVVPLSNFYTHQIDSAQIANFNHNFPDVGLDNNNLSPAGLDSMMKVGNYALMVGMHITTKEIVKWTWQTYWWSPDANKAPFGHDRPSSIPSPWNNYVMDMSYSMMTPPDDFYGEPIVAFNPYIETRLSFKFTPNGRDSVQDYGMNSNCLSCHSLATYPMSEGFQYLSTGYVDLADTFLFKNKTKTDFMWSFLTRVKTVSKE